MKRLATVAALAVLVGALLGTGSAGANNPGTVVAPLLECTDVNGDGAVGVGDIAKVVALFGATTASPSYRLLYDVAPPVGSIAATDIGYVVQDFGDNNANGTCPLVDTQIAQATLWVVRDNPGLLTENPALLTSLGFFSSQIDAPGQGLHYGRTGARDGTFELFPPDALVYNNGKLVAELYYIEGDEVGWGPVEPPPPDQVDIDAFCSMPPGDACSWAGSGDGWHWHQNLCTYAIGPTNTQHAITTTAAGCETLHNAACSGSKCAGTTWTWDDRVGWMGHLWNHYGNPNGRFADCVPDGVGWKGFNCPQ